MKLVTAILCLLVVGCATTAPPETPKPRKACKTLFTKNAVTYTLVASVDCTPVGEEKIVVAIIVRGTGKKIVRRAAKESAYFLRSVGLPKLMLWLVGKIKGRPFLVLVEEQ